MSSISLSGSLKTCKVNTGWADKIYSDRYFNTQTMACPMWNGQDMYGRQVSPDSYKIKSMGCSLPADLTGVETAQRPSYFQYINLDATGLNGGLNYVGNADAGMGTLERQYVKNIVGTGAYGLGGAIQRNCNTCGLVNSPVVASNRLTAAANQQRRMRNIRLMNARAQRTRNSIGF